MLVNAKLEIPEEMIPALLDGTNRISEAVIRNNQSARFVDFVDLSISEDSFDNSSDPDRSLATMIVLGSVTTFLFGGLAYLYTKRKKKKTTIPIPACIIRFRDDLRIYLNDAQMGDIKVDSINNLLSDLGEIEATQHEDVSIDISTEEIRSLLNQIFEFTKALANEYEHPFAESEGPTGNNLSSFREYLLVQRDIVNAV